MSAGFNFEPGDRVVIDGVEQLVDRMVPALREGDPDDVQFVARTGRITSFTEDEFVALYNAGKIRLLSRTERLEDRPPEEEGAAARARRRLKYVKAFDANPVAKTEKPLRAFIARVAAQIGDPNPPSTGSIRRWTRGRGEPGLRKLREMVEHYRPKKGSRLDAFVEAALVAQMERYWNSARVTAKEVWARVVTAIDDKNAELLLPADQLIPTIAYSTVWRRCQAGMTYERCRRRYGSKEAARRFKAIKGSLEVEHLLELGIMDHTEVDCWVIDDVTLQPIGRPRITFLIDSCSRYPLGFSIGWKSASVEAAMACLRHAFPKKADLRERFPEVRHEWLAYGMPREILVDQGLEFVGTSFEDACADLGISLRIAPARTPEFKGQIERFIETANLEAFHRFHGSVPGKPRELQALGIDPQKDAVLLLSELEALINKWIVDVYTREVHRTLNAAPALVWQMRRKTDPIELCPDLATLNATCSKSVKRVLTRSGIELNNLIYRSEEVSHLLEALSRRARKRNGSAHGVEVKVKYHPDNLASVYVWDEARSDYVELPCTKAKYAKGLSEHLHRKMREWAKETNRAFSTEVEMCRARVELYELMETMTAHRVRDRKRLQRLRHPERQLRADRVRVQTIDGDESGSALETSGTEILIDPLRNRTGGSYLHSRRLLKAKVKARPKSSTSVSASSRTTIVDLRDRPAGPLANFDFAAEVAIARADAEDTR